MDKSSSACLGIKHPCFYPVFDDYWQRLLLLAIVLHLPECHRLCIEWLWSPVSSRDAEQLDMMPFIIVVDGRTHVGWRSIPIFAGRGRGNLAVELEQTTIIRWLKRREYQWCLDGQTSEMGRNFSRNAGQDLCWWEMSLCITQAYVEQFEGCSRGYIKVWRHQ